MVGCYFSFGGNKLLQVACRDMEDRVYCGSRPRSFGNPASRPNRHFVNFPARVFQNVAAFCPAISRKYTMSDLSGYSASRQKQPDAEPENGFSEAQTSSPEAMTTLTLGADFDHALHNQALDATMDSAADAKPIPLIFDSSIPTDRMDDHMLIAGTREGDEAAFQELVNRYRNPITNFVYRMLNDYERAVDLSQETFVRIYMNADKYQANYSFSTYIYRIASNLAISELRQRKRRKLMQFPTFFNKEGEEVEMEIEDSRIADPDDSMINDERRKAIAKAIATLPEKYRTAVVLRDVEGRSYEEIGEVLGLSDGTVKSRINRARNLLKEKLSEFL